jgi:hypothetical protein
MRHLQIMLHVAIVPLSEQQIDQLLLMLPNIITRRDKRMYDQ